MDNTEKKRKRVQTHGKTKEKELVFLYDDNEKNPNYNRAQKKGRRRRSSRSKPWIIAGSAVGVLLAAYLGFAFYFDSHFYFYTVINGSEFSGKSVKDVESFMAGQVDGYVLTVKKNDGTAEQIAGRDLALAYRPGPELEEALKGQNPFLWPKAFLEKDELDIPTGVTYDQNALLKAVASLQCVADKKTVKPVSASPVFDGTKYVIQPEVLGNTVDQERFVKVIEEHLNGFNNELDMTEQKCYLQPDYFSNSKEVLDAQKLMNRYIDSVVTYDFHPYTEVVDKKQISEWLTVDKKMKPVFRKKKVEAYIAGLAKKYDTSGKPRTFVTADGNTVQVKNGIYGWKISQSKEYEKLTDDIRSGKHVEREPQYIRRAKTHKGNDFGSTYAEVDLTKQQMWFIKDGKIVLESQIVTGKPSTGHATPQGTYTVTYTQKGAVLRGKILPNGKREYETPVDYWMPFNGGIGFHDATWQSSFGGERYLTHGSHGCVNMPHEKAEELFGYLKAGTPVICHY